ncbi:MAG: hypothetical protein HRT77_00695 [Halioglobus sp.]|nr:hypothetical protein [Halioglobus sp.]
MQKQIPEHKGMQGQSARRLRRARRAPVPATFITALLIASLAFSDGSEELAADSRPTNAGDATATAEFLRSDDFERDNAQAIGGVWTDCKTIHPDFFEPLGIHDGGVVIADPFTRPGLYGQKQRCPTPLEEGRMYPGIGCAFVDTGSTTVSVKIIWSGNHGISKPLPVAHVEATPLLYVTPGNSRFGFGAWISEFWGKPIVFAGYLGAPVENFEVVVATLLDAHEPGTPRELELRAEKAGEVTVWIDGKQLAFGEKQGLKPIRVDDALAHSTLHGITVDAHCVKPASEVPLIKGIESASIEVID